MVQCPFCKEDDFDLEGLKLHYQAGYCDVFNATIDLPYRMPRKEAQQEAAVDLQTATNKPSALCPNCNGRGVGSRNSDGLPNTCLVCHGTGTAHVG